MSTTSWSRFRGDTHPAEFAIRDTAGAAIDLTGWTAFLLTVNSERNPLDATNELAQIGGTITDAAGGLVEFPGTALGTLPAGVVWYDVQATDAASSVRTVSKGRLRVDQDITK